MATPHILVVDDEESILEFVSWALTEEGYKVTCAPNGKAALETLEKMSPDLILLDLRMPVMDGQAFLDAYQRQEGPRAPVVVLTAGSQSPKGLESASAFLPKPFDLGNLLTVIERHTVASATLEVGRIRQKQ